MRNLVNFEQLKVFQLLLVNTIISKTIAYSLFFIESFVLLPAISFCFEGFLYAEISNTAMNPMEIKAGIFFLILKYNQRAVYTCHLIAGSFFCKFLQSLKTLFCNFYCRFLQLIVQFNGRNSTNCIKSALIVI